MNKNYYIALRFRNRPDLHMTVKYHKDFTDEDLAHLMKTLNAVLGILRHSGEARAFSLFMYKSAMFGRNHDIRVLMPKDPLPSWITDMSENTRWRPHVTCSDESLFLVVDAVAIMHKKEEIQRWTLSE